MPASLQNAIDNIINHDLPLRLYITLQSQIDQVITILYLIIRYLLLPNSLYMYLLTFRHLHNIVEHLETRKTVVGVSRSDECAERVMAIVRPRYLVKLAVAGAVDGYI